MAQLDGYGKIEKDTILTFRANFNDQCETKEKNTAFFMCLYEHMCVRERERRDRRNQ